MIKIEHIAIWVDDIEMMCQFYEKYFDAKRGDKYINPTKKYTAYFLTFGKDSSRIELMHRPDIISNDNNARGFVKGLAHIAISVGSTQKVDDLTLSLQQNGYLIESAPRTTGDGYYESVIRDPEGNFIEITQ